MTGSRHQSHAAVNANARSRVAGTPFKTVEVSHPYCDDTSVYELEGRLTQIQEREFEWKVRHQISDRDAVDYDALRNRENQLGPVHSACVPIVTSNDPLSYAAAVNKRSNFIQEGPQDDVGDMELAQSLAIIAELPDLFDVWEENDADRERWLAKFDEGKQKRMREAWDNRDLGDIKELTSKNGSVKIEALAGKRFDKTAAGRIIYAGTDLFNAVTGPASMVKMERLVALLSSELPDGAKLTVGEVEFMLGYKKSEIEIASFIKDERFPDIVEGDFSRNDREQRSRVAVIVRAWMAKIGIPEWYLDLMDTCEHYSLTNREFGLRVQLMYQLATGTTNTTFRNSVYNMTMFAVIARRQKRRGKALVLGDDILAALDRRLRLQDWIDDVAKFKMVLKAKAPALDGEATFLSRRLFVDVEIPTMIPLLGKMLVRFNVRANNNDAMSDSHYMAAKSLSYAFGCKHVHFLRDIFLRRFEMEGAREDVLVEDLGWAARTNGYTTQQIIEITRNAPNLVSFEEFSFWSSKVYDLDICEVEELFEATVLSTDVVVLELANIEKMRMDFD